MKLKWKFIYLGRRPRPSPPLSPDVLADVVDLKLSSETCSGHISVISLVIHGKEGHGHKFLSKHYVTFPVIN